MISRILATLFCSVASVPLFAQTVELRSTDGFISVEGEIIGFDGAMIQVRTSVGAVSLPASDVVCYGPNCLNIVSSNAFGLSAASFRSVIGQSADEAQDQPGVYSVGFVGAGFPSMLRTLAGGYAIVGEDGVEVDIDVAGQISLEDSATGETAVLTITEAGAMANIVIEALPLAGTEAGIYQTAADWATGTDVSSQMLGLRAFSVLVASNAGVSQISVDDLARIFAGEVTNWSQVGGANVNVLPLQLPNTSEVHDEMIRLIMAPAGKTIAGNVLTMTDEPGIVAAINQFPGSIGIVNTAAADPSLTVDVAGTCGIAVSPTEFNIISGDYPLTRPVMATYNRPADNTLMAGLFDFAATDVAQGLLAGEGFINPSAVLQDASLKNARLSALLGASLDEVQRTAAAAMFQTLFEADRLSISVTGGAASAAEGAWNRAMMLDLAEALGDPALAGREVIFAGFGESTAGSAAALNASAAAAADVLAAFRQVAPDLVANGNFTFASFGFGDVSPTTCYAGQVAGPDSTRVEVWVRQPS